MREIWTFYSAGQLVFGPGAIAQVGEQAARIGLKRVLVVTDRVLEKAGLVGPVLESLTAGSIGWQVFVGGEPEPTLELAETCAEAARKFRPDGIVGVGGGSNMDLAKITAVMLTHGGGVREYLGDDGVPGPVLPLVCVPTTAGTGSEVSASAVLTDRDRGLKVGALSNFLRPKIAVVDPRLTLTCPRKVTADSGIDALTHAIEALTAVDNAEFPLPPGERSTYQGRHLLGDMMAEKAIELIGQNLLRAVNHPDDLDARSAMALAATLAGLAFSNVGVAVVHALEYPVGVATHCSHGEGNGLLLPFCMRFNMPVRRREFGRIAQLLGRDVKGLSEEAAAEEAIRAVEDLKVAIGIPQRLRDLGTRREDLRTFAERAFTIQRILRVNPRPVTVDDLEAILESAY